MVGTPIFDLLKETQSVGHTKVFGARVTRRWPPKSTSSLMSPGYPTATATATLALAAAITIDVAGFRLTGHPPAERPPPQPSAGRRAERRRVTRPSEARPR